MIKLLLALVFTISINCLWAQVMNDEQQKAIQTEQQKLKEGKISYEEYQKRYDKIVNPPKMSESKKEDVMKGTVVAKSDSSSGKAVANDTAVVKKQEAAPEQNKKEVAGISDSTTNPSGIIINKTPENFSHQLKPGDELIKFTNNFYGGIIVAVLSTVPMILGSIVLVYSSGTAGLGMYLLGGTGLVAGSVYSLASFRHIKKAGQLLNIQQQNPR